MTESPDYAQIIRCLTSDNSSEQQAARAQVFTLDETAVAPLIDEFYAGVSEQAGLAVLDVLSEIGGFEVLALLEDVYHLGARYESWRALAADRLRREGRL